MLTGWKPKVTNSKHLFVTACCVLVLFSAVSCRAPVRLSPDWNGTWKLDPAKSNIPGPSLVVSISPDGVYRTELPGGDEEFRCDGKERRSDDIHTATCTQKNSSNLEAAFFRNGTKVVTTHWELSRNEKLLTIRHSHFNANKSVKTGVSEYIRTAGSAGFVGQWRSLKPLAGISPIIQITLRRNVLHEFYPDLQQHVDLPLNGADGTVRGPSVRPGASNAIEAHSPREFGEIYKINGKVIDVGVTRISADGRTLTESYWSPDHLSEKAVLVYVKQ